MTAKSPSSPAWARFYANHPEVLATYGEARGEEPRCTCRNCQTEEES